LLKNAFVFAFYNQFGEAFDNHILEQIKAGAPPLKVPFSQQAFAYLQRRGFGAEDARHYFALCYQFRRAFYFIYYGLVGRSVCMKELRRNLWDNVFTHNIGLYDEHLWDRMEDFSTLLLGETGTGKGTAANAIGRSGFIPFDEKKQCFAESFTQSFVDLNVSQFPESLIESELFGHKKGAFTGAVEDHKGVFARCSPFGAIFLDEIGEIAAPVQIKLLQVLQERVFSPVGDHQKTRFQGRVIAATNRPISEIRKRGLFRDDFFYRLCSDLITVPTLRQRIQEDPSELDDLLTHTIERIVGKPSPELTEMVREVIARQLGNNYPWPGNVRELEQCVRRVLLKRDYEGDHHYAAPDARSELMEGIGTGTLDGQSVLAGYCYLLYQQYGTFEEVARRAKLDRRTVKKYIQEWKHKDSV
jgi:DNA-binding NtrC family response regulator